MCTLAHSVTRCACGCACVARDIEECKQRENDQKTGGRTWQTKRAAVLESRCKRLGARGGREGASPVLGRMPNSSGGHTSSATQSTRTPAKKPSLSQRLTPRRKPKAASSPSESKAPASSVRGEKSSTSTPKTSQKKRGKASSSARSGAAPATERPLSQRDAIRAASPDEKAELLELATYIAQLRKTEEEEEEVVVAVKEEEATVAQDAEAPETSAAAPLGAATSSSVGTSSVGGSSSSSGSTTTTTAAVQLGAGLSALAGLSTPPPPLMWPRHRRHVGWRTSGLHSVSGELVSRRRPIRCRTCDHSSSSRDLCLWGNSHPSRLWCRRVAAISRRRQCGGARGSGDAPHRTGPVGSGWPTAAAAAARTGTCSVGIGGGGCRRRRRGTGVLRQGSPLAAEWTRPGSTSMTWMWRGRRRRRRRRTTTTTSVG